MKPMIYKKEVASDITLSELLYHIGESLRAEFTKGYWFSCDIDSINFHTSGNVYLTLSHKNKEGKRSSANAIIWKNYASLIEKFESKTGIRFTKNISVLFLGEVSFSSEYGLSIKVLDINPTFSIGQHELKLRQIREQLKARGYSSLNRSLAHPREFTRVAVIGRC
ncbi:exodeoxyribonuclease VII large subunit [Motilimonas pumila]|uniref:OB-fold nucleic acid binding domain-containing protein n=1 Tax=Motilimonas pumila TaxID=2303987 RepID=A0A418Y970_9GAMM|nr:exodeoxyribonuclease VII large subunit [Motilimonas pumila]RJG36586.1 hypothetical protein D1Z90_20315 [Motilimonas pumila]